MTVLKIAKSIMDKHNISPNSLSDFNALQNVLSVIANPLCHEHLQAIQYNEEIGEMAMNFIHLSSEKVLSPNEPPLRYDCHTEDIKLQFDIYQIQQSTVLQDLKIARYLEDLKVYYPNIRNDFKVYSASKEYPYLIGFKYKGASQHRDGISQPFIFIDKKWLLANTLTNMRTIKKYGKIITRKHSYRQYISILCKDEDTAKQLLLIFRKGLALSILKEP